MGTTNQAGCRIEYRLEPSDLDSRKDTIAIVQLVDDKGMDQLYDRGSGNALEDVKIPKLKEAYVFYYYQSC